MQETSEDPLGQDSPERFSDFGNRPVLQVTPTAESSFSQSLQQTGKGAAKEEYRKDSKYAEVSRKASREP